MRRLTAALLFVLSAQAAKADFLSTFEDQGLPANSFRNDAGASGRFVSGGNSFNNTFDPTFNFWGGWAVSSKTDSATPGFGNQYSSITGGGANGSPTYGVGYTFFGPVDPVHPDGSFVDLVAGTNPVSVQVTNTAYDYYSMRDGDGFAKKFGPGDFLLLTVKGYDTLGGTGGVVGSVDFYLANFLGANRDIVNSWQSIDLTRLAGSKSLRFGLSSSDNDPLFGMNTPAYFAADNLAVASSVPEPPAWGTAAAGLVALGLIASARRSVRQTA